MTIYKVSDDKLEEQKVITGRSAISAIAYTPNGSLLAVGDAQGKITVYDTSNFEVNTMYIVLNHVIVTL